MLSTTHQDNPEHLSDTVLDFDITRLTAFNPLLVANFIPEASVAPRNHDDFDYLHGAAGQYQDILNAYLYAQDDILTFLKKNPETPPTPDQILT